MPYSIGPRIALFLVVGCITTWLALCPGLLSAQSTQALGIKSTSGKFLPKVHVYKEDSSILVIKKNPREKFASLKIRFTFPGVKRKGAMESVYIQWGKSSKQMGRLYPIINSKFFHEPTKTFDAKWTASQAFRIVNRNKNRTFEAYAWNQVIHMWLNGKRLTMGRSPISPAPKPVQTKPQAPGTLKQVRAPSPEPKPRQKTVTPSLGPLKQKPSPAIQNTAQTKPASRSTTAAPKQTKAIHSQNSGHEAMVRSATNPDRTKIYALQKKYDSLAKKYALLEKELASTQRWYYFGPLLALIFSLMFTGASIFASHVLLSRGRRLRALSPRQVSPVSSRSQGRFRTAG